MKKYFIFTILAILPNLPQTTDVNLVPIEQSCQIIQVSGTVSFYLTPVIGHAGVTKASQGSRGLLEFKWCKKTFS